GLGIKAATSLTKAWTDNRSADTFSFPIGAGVVFQGCGSGPVAPTAPTAPFGRVLSCRGSEARVGLPRQVAERDQRATVGKLLAIKSGGNIVLAMIAEVNAQLRATDAGEHCATALVDLMGEIVRDESGGGHFRRGVRGYPAIGDEVEIVEANDLNLIYAS